MSVITLTNIAPDLEYSLPDDYALNISIGESYITQLKKTDVLPFNKGTILYSQNIWNFKGYTTRNISPSMLKFIFEKVNENFRDDTKNYVLFKIIENTDKIQTINKSFRVLRRFFNYADKKCYCNVQDLDDTIFKEYFSKREQSVEFTTIVGDKEALKDFYRFYSANFKDIYTKEIKEAFTIDYRLYHSLQSENKTPNIHNDYFDKFISTIIKIIDDVTAPSSIRSTACIYLILSQTGLRISEVLELEINMINETTIFNGETAYFLSYKSPKPAKGNNNYIPGKTYINYLSKKGYDTLVEIYKNKRTSLNVPYLFLGGDLTHNFPVNYNCFEPYKLRLALYIVEYNYMEIANLEQTKYPNLSHLRFSEVKRKSYGKKYSHIETLTFPTNHQFRVHVCSELYEKGVPLQYIEKFMSHLTDEMQGYYVRTTPSNPQEDMNFSFKTLEEIATGELEPLGGTGELSKRIKEFIKENNFNIATDKDTIVKSLVKKIPIRQKTGGVCIKASLIRDCSVDYQTDEFYCTYGVCPNIFHFYYMADISYIQARDSFESVLYNKENGYLRQAEKELHKLKRIVKEKLLIELDELKKVIERKGVDLVLKEYPDLLEIIINLDSIYKEAEQWQSMMV